MHFLWGRGRLCHVLAICTGVPDLYRQLPESQRPGPFSSRPIPDSLLQHCYLCIKCLFIVTYFKVLPSGLLAVYRVQLYFDCFRVIDVVFYF